MIRSLAISMIVFLAAACGPYPGGLKMDELSVSSAKIIAIDAHEQLLIEPFGSSEMSIYWSEGSARCNVTSVIARSWESIREACSDSTPETRTDISVDPNRRILEAVVAFVWRIDDDQFEIRYVESEDKMLEAADALETILRECELNVSFDVLVYLKP